jgi:hypothetical protein
LFSANTRREIEMARKKEMGREMEIERGRRRYLSE